MASAYASWAGQPANDERRVLQVGRDVPALFNRHLTSGARRDVLLITRALHARVRNGPRATPHGARNASTVRGRDLFGAQWRRSVWPRGALGRRQGRHSLTPLPPIQKLIDGFDPAPEPPAGRQHGYRVSRPAARGGGRPRSTRWRRRGTTRPVLGDPSASRAASRQAGRRHQLVVAAAMRFVA
jgi:hypothetical protein